MNPFRVAIVGAGVSGLACGLRLLELAKEKNFSLELNILDGSPKAGGTLSTIEKEGFLMEEGPDCFITDKPAAIELCQKLGLEKELIRTNPDLKQSFILKNGRLHPIPEGFYLLAPSRLWPLVTTSLLSPWGKFRAGLEPFVKVRKDVQDESVGSFVRRRLGQEVLDWLAQPLIGGVYNADPDDLSLSAAMPKFKEMEKKYGSLLRALAAARQVKNQPQVSGARYSLFASFSKGMGTLAESMESQIPAESLWLETPVLSLKPTGKGPWEVEVEGRSQEVDAVVLAIQPAKMRPLIGKLDTEWDKLLAGIPSHDSATLNLGFRRADVGHPLDGFGFVVPARENKLILGCTFASQKFENRAAENHVLLRAFLGAEAVAQLKAEGEAVLLEKVLEELNPILQLKDRPIVHHLAVYKDSMSYFRPGHLSQAARLEQKAHEFKGLYLAGNGFKGVGIPDCIAAGQSAAEKIFVELS